MANKNPSPRRRAKPPLAKPKPRPNEPAPVPEPPSPLPAATPPSELSSAGCQQPIVVGLGASAGGLNAFKKFFNAMPPQSGLAFVLIPHLDPNHESLMAELLSRQTQMPVVEAQDNSQVEVNHVYIIPPNKNMTIDGGVLRLTGPIVRRAQATPIDLFLRSLAEDQRERAIGIILSGTGGHGTLGLKAIKANGGMAMVQDPATAEHDSMPMSAAATGLADYVLPPEEMPQALRNYARHFDGSGVHPAVVARADTGFFRDPEAFHILETRVLPTIFRAKAPGQPVRVWVAGSASGEQAYSLGILLLERRSAQQTQTPLQVFATDMDDASLQASRLGTYSDRIAADVSPERLSRYFSRVDDRSFRINKELRELVIIARQNLTHDAPFSRIDLISCRDLLHQLEPEVRRKIIALFHFSLAKGGYLMLGPSETIGHQVDLFEPVSKKWRIYRRIGATRPKQVDFPSVAPTRGNGKKSAPGRPHPLSGVDFADLTHQSLLEAYSPAAVLVNRRNEILYFFGPISAYLNQPAGEPTQDLMRLARDGLRAKLHAAVHRAIRDSQAVFEPGVRFRRDGSFAAATIAVRPVHSPHEPEGLLLVTFQDERAAVLAAPPPAGEPEESIVRHLECELKATREDLQGTIEELESANEELKAANEEMMSMNEELESANEELEISKEELESLNEEVRTVNSQLQEKVEELDGSTNDMANLLNCTEIGCVFLDAQFRITRFTPAATKLFNLIPADVGRPISDIAQKFLDPDLLQAVRCVFHDLVQREAEVASERGDSYLRRIIHYRTLDNRIEGVVIAFIDITQRKKDEEALRQLSLQLEQRTAELEQTNRRLLVEISERQAAQKLASQLAAIVEGSDDAIIGIALDGTITSWNAAAERLFGDPAEEWLGKQFFAILPSNQMSELRQIHERVARGERVAQFEAEHVRKGGERVIVSLSSAPIRDDQGNVVGISAICRDITRQKHLERAVQESRTRLAAIVDSAGDALITIDETGRIDSFNKTAEKMFGYTAGQIVGKNVSLLMPAPFHQAHDRYLENYRTTSVAKIIGIGREVVALRKDGTTFPVDLAISEFRDGTRRLFTGLIRDITERRALESEVLNAASEEQHRIGQDLHDSVGQELTGLGLMAEALVEGLAGQRSPSLDLASRISQGIKRSLGQVRILSKGLSPVELDYEGLMMALQDLAARVGAEFGVPCEFQCAAPISITDNFKAAHLYRITQEAVTNALKHSQTKRVQIGLALKDRHIVLKIADDGIGIPEGAGHAQGMGLKIMRYRANLIGATLTIDSAKGSGTVVTCVLPSEEAPSDLNASKCVPGLEEGVS